MIKYGILLIVVFIAVIFDIRFRKIPNALTFPAMAGGLLIQFITSGLEGALYGFWGILVGMGLFFMIYLLGVMGAGDAKLVGAVGSFVGPKGALIVSLLTALAGGVYALILLLFYRLETKGIFKNLINTLIIFALSKKLVLGDKEGKEGTPKLCFAIAIAAGTVVYMVIEAMGYKII